MSLITGHEEDIRTLRAEIANELMNLRQSLGAATGEGKVKGLPLKDMKPDKFESNKKSEQSFKQWLEDMLAWLKRLDADYGHMIRVASGMNEWNSVVFRAKLVELGVAPDKQRELDENFMDILKKFTKGDARDLVDTTTTGGEAWYRLNDRFYAKTVIGATSIASTLQEMKRPTSLNESFQRLTEIRGLVKEFQRQSPSEPMPTAIIKAAYMKVVPGAYKKGLEMQVDVDRSDVGIIEDKIMTFIRSNGNGPAGMDIGTFEGDMSEMQGKGPGSATTPGTSNSSWLSTPMTWSSSGAGAYHMQPGWESWGGYSEGAGSEHGSGQDGDGGDVNAFNKGKGKGKGKGKPGGKSVFYGQCYNCGQSGHSAKFCPEKNKGKSKGKGYGKYGGKTSFNYFAGDSSSPSLGIPTLCCLEKNEPENNQADLDWQVPVKFVHSLRKPGKKASPKKIFESPNPYHLLGENMHEHDDIKDPEQTNIDQKIPEQINIDQKIPEQVSIYKKIRHDDAKIPEQASIDKKIPEQVSIKQEIRHDHDKNRKCMAFCCTYNKGCEMNDGVCAQRLYQHGGKKHRTVKFEIPEQQMSLDMQDLNILEKGGVELCELEQTEWVPLPKPLVIDSGAGETVIPTSWLQAHRVRDSPGSQLNEFYTTADGTKVYNEGEKELIVSSLDGAQCRAMTFQVAKVNKALGSVNQMVRRGNRVVFDQDEQGRDISYILHKATNQRMFMRPENGVYVLDVLVAPPEYQQQIAQASQTGGFARQGR